MPQFVHLHVHTQYSILDGQASVQRLVDKAMADGQPGIAVTDHGDMFGIKEFYNYVQKVKGKCKDKAAEAEARIAALRDGTETCADPAAEIAKCERQLEECRRKLAFKPIIGCEVYVARRRLHDKEGKPTPERLPPDPAGQEPQGIPQPHQDRLEGVDRRFLHASANRPHGDREIPRGADLLFGLSGGRGSARHHGQRPRKGRGVDPMAPRRSSATTITSNCNSTRPPSSGPTTRPIPCSCT